MHMGQNRRQVRQKNNDVHAHTYPFFDSEIRVLSTYILDQKYGRRHVRFRRRHGTDDERSFLLESLDRLHPNVCIEGDDDMSSVLDWRLLF
jgi:hypothetical protein